jgi:hypothetical protein
MYSMKAVHGFFCFTKCNKDVLMSIIKFMLITIGLSIDTFAISLSNVNNSKID